MEWLKDIALPQSAEHIELLRYMLVIVVSIFTVFSSAIMFGTCLSIYFKSKEKKYLDLKYSNLAKDIIEVVLANKSIGLIFCILPVITAILIFTQLFQSSSNANLEYLTGSLVFITISILFLYSYKNSFHEFTDYSSSSGLLGVATLFLALWLFNVALSLSSDSNNTTGLIEELFSLSVLIRFLLFILISVAISGSIILFGLFYLKENKIKEDAEYQRLVKKFSLRITFTATVFIPFFLLIYLLILPASSLSGSVFVYVTIGLVLVFVTYHLVYLLFKQLNKTLVGLLLLTLLGFVMAFTIGDQLVISNSSRVQSAVLIANYNNYLDGLKGGGEIAEISGEEIYEVKCASCHTFDNKMVGPPHNEVVPKYFGKENQLVAYLRNPVKVDPEYPLMPNPGLKPDEAKAVAEYVLSKVKENIGK